ncbi:hypothetical protein OAM06_00405 [Pelagibacteraceae bacterium]|nr:hypothetical protein [Pelagibacteraceae bacterium]
MIYKSYLIEQNFLINENLTLFYGENLGLKNFFQKTIKEHNKDNEIIIYNQEDILKDENQIYNEILNRSLFNVKKVFLVNGVSDKIIDQIQKIEQIIDDRKIYFFSEVLEKKSKLRNYFEKSANTAIIPCYSDNEITIKKIIQERLSGFKNLNNQTINLILNSCGLDRVKINNEIQKIITCFANKEIDQNKLETLLNIRENEDFNALKDQALIGNKISTNKFMSNTIIEPEKNVMYLNIINQRLNKLLEIDKIKKNGRTEDAVSSIKPPIFWKDKATIILQAQKWNKAKINSVLKDTFNLEIIFKSNSKINQTLLVKKLLIDICNLANS